MRGEKTKARNKYSPGISPRKHGFFINLWSKTKTPLQRDLDSTLVARSALGKVGQEVGDIIPRMPVQTRPQPFLIQIMRDQTDAPAKNKQAVENTHVQIVFGLFGAEGAAIAHQIYEANGDATVDVEDEIVLLGRRDGFNRDGVVQHFAAGEALLDKLLDQLDAEIRVVA